MNGVLVVFLLLVQIICPTESQQDYACYQPVEIVVLMDSSSVFGERNFNDLKKFAKRFVTFFELDRTGLAPAIGFIAYSSARTPNQVVNFFQSSSSKRLTGRISALRYEGRRLSRMDIAMGYARNFLFKTNRGSRLWVPRVVLAITGSLASWRQYLKESVKVKARTLRSRGVRLLFTSIGPTNQVDREYLESMVSSKDDVFVTRYPLRLLSVAKKIAKQVCPIPSTLPCPGKVDVAFIADSSGSINKVDYAKMKYFMYSIANSLTVSETGARAGVVIYSHISELAIKFSDHKDIDSFRRAAYALRHMKSYTRIDLGLKVAHEQLFSPIYGGARPGVKKLAFIMTDGKQTAIAGKKADLREAARPLIARGVKTLAVGIGSRFDKMELRAMVESDRDVITAVNFDALLKQIENITEQTCQEVAFTECKSPADFAFLLDSSDLRNDDFETMKKFVSTLSQRFTISPYGSRSSVIVYGSQAFVFIRLDESRNSSEFATAVSEVLQVGGRRSGYKALELAENVLMTFRGGARRRVPKVVVLFTTGPERDATALQRAAKKLHSREMLVVVVGIGSGLSNAQLSPLVQSPENIFRVSSFTDLVAQLPPLANQICENIGPGFCETKIDLAFILDSSGSIGKDEFDEAKNFVEELSKAFSISQDKTHVALMIYSDEARIMSKFGKILSQQELRKKLDELPHLRGKTRIDLALKLASAELFTSKGGMRLSQSKLVAIVITDGRQSPAFDAIRLDEAVAPLLVRGVKVLSIGISDKINQLELNMMVSNPEKHTFRAQTYKALGVQLASIARESCSQKTFYG